MSGTLKLTTALIIFPPSPSDWSVLQFQQICGAPVTLWCELLRQKDASLPGSKVDAVLASASVASCWASCTIVRDSPLVVRNDLVIRLCYEITETGNEYSEDVQCVDCIYSPFKTGSAVLVRLVK